MEFQRAKQVIKNLSFYFVLYCYQINNENLKNEVKNAERREEIIKQVQQENQSKFLFILTPYTNLIFHSFAII